MTNPAPAMIYPDSCCFSMIHCQPCTQLNTSVIAIFNDDDGSFHKKESGRHQQLVDHAVHLFSFEFQTVFKKHFNQPVSIP
jgi:hypothetical protein